MKLWIDDERPKPKDFDLVARNYQEALEIIANNEITYISFDHDLGEEKTGYDIVCWLEEEIYYGRLKKFEWNVHSANPSGAKKMILTLEKMETF